MKKNSLFAFPTETVYGIGCRFDDKASIKKIFTIKKRPQDKPLQILVSNLDQVKKLTKEIPALAQDLIQKYWPGPLTILFFKSSLVPDFATAGSEKVGLRMPNNKKVLELIEKIGPIAATSANISNEPPLLTAQEVKKAFPELDLIFEGKIKIGQASTVVDATGKRLIILRNGPIKIDF